MTMRLERFENWHSILAEEIELARDRPFAWGVHDCVMWAFRCAWLISGAELASHLPGRWRTANGALALARKWGGARAVIAATMRSARLADVNPSFAQRGDLVMVLNPADAPLFDAALGVMLGAQLASVPPDGGLAFMPASHAVQAWGV